MRPKNLILIIPSLCILLLAAGVVLAQNDPELIREGRAAIMQKSCDSGRAALEKVSPNGREDTDWVEWMAKSYECTENANNLKAAVSWYEKYIVMPLPPEKRSEAVAHLADLRYRARKRSKEEATREALLNDLTGLWQFFDGTVRITQTGNSVKAVFEKIRLRERVTEGWTEGDLVFEGSKEGNYLSAKVYVRFNKYAPELQKCGQVVTVNMKLEFKEDYFGDSDTGVLILRADENTIIPSQDSDCRRAIRSGLYSRNSWTKVNEDGSLVRIERLLGKPGN